jgi:hypothetical protein
MSGTRKKDQPLSQRRKNAKSGSKKGDPKKGSSSKLYDAPFDVEVCDDGDMATPKRNFDEDAIKEEEDRGS